MAKSTRLKIQPLATRADFNEQISALLQLEVQKRKIIAERDAELLQVTERHKARLVPIDTDIKGRMALAKDYATSHRTELLAKKDAKSFVEGAGRAGWHTGNRTVELRHGVTAEKAVAALLALHLDGYVRVKYELDRSAILSDCKDDKTLSREKRDRQGVIQMKDGEPIIEAVELAAAGLKITQAEVFFVESNSEAAETLKAPEVAAA
jgi:phage host-nuclease inhibitor protein Gam